MASELEEQKKLILPYAQRAEEIKKVDPKIAYYCRLFAVDQGLKIDRSRRCKEIDDLLAALLKQLERDKPGVVLDKENDKFYCEDFAIKVFNRADKVDRAGKADANTALAYYAASVFFDILNQFGELDADLTKQQRYGLWRAAEIRKAVREGRQPNPPPGQENFSLQSATADSFPQPASAQPPQQPAVDNTWPSAERPITPPSEVSGLPAASSLDPPPFASSFAAAPVHPCRFPPGSRVLYYVAPGSALEAGTVGKVNAHEGGYTCVVALRDRLVEADESALCLDVAEGSLVLYVTVDGQMMPATVIAATTSTWPAQYLLRLSSGASEVTADPWHVASPAATQQNLPTVPNNAPFAAAPEGPYASIPHSTLPPPPVVPPPHPTPPSAPSTQSDYNLYPTLDSMRAPSHTLPAAAAPSVPYTASGPPDVHNTVPQASSYQPSIEAMSEAHKQAKYAVSSLAFDDAENAVKYLRKALNLLTGGNQ